MSIRFLTWAFHLPLPDMAAKGVLNALADHADENGRSWPSVARLALYTGCDERTARRALQRLVGLGLVEREPRPGKSDVFILRMDVDPSQNQPLSKTTPVSVTPPNEAQTPDNVTGDPGQRDHDPGHVDPRTFMNRQGTLRTRAREATPPNQSPRLQLPDTAKWAERLANHRPLEGAPRWTNAWAPSPDSAGRNSLIPEPLYREWRARYDEGMAALRAERSHEARQDGAMATPCAMTNGEASSRPTDPRQAA